MWAIAKKALMSLLLLFVPGDEHQDQELLEDLKAKGSNKVSLDAIRNAMAYIRRLKLVRLRLWAVMICGMTYVILELSSDPWPKSSIEQLRASFVFPAMCASVLAFSILAVEGIGERIFSFKSRLLAPEVKDAFSEENALLLRASTVNSDEHTGLLRAAGSGDVLTEQLLRSTTEETT